LFFGEGASFDFTFVTVFFLNIMYKVKTERFGVYMFVKNTLIIYFYTVINN